MSRFARLLLALTLVAAALVSPLYASPSWTVTRLHPNVSWTESAVFGGFGGQQVGVVLGPNQAAHASLWNGSAESWTDLNPAGASGSYAVKTSGLHQVGFARIGTAAQAGYWTGSAESWVNLNPMNSTESVAYGVSSIYQVGSARVGGVTRASRWSGNADTWEDLHPTIANASVAYGEFDGRQVGDTSFVIPSFPFSWFYRHAALWNGSAASWVDLNPAGASESSAFAIHGDQQVGYASFSVSWRASLWLGSADSWMDLHPAGHFSSVAYDVYDGIQVGSVTNANGLSRASLWRGTSESWEDLSMALSGEWGDSGASSIWSDGDTLYVGGYGLNLLTGNDEALLWSRPVPEPTSYLFFLLAGSAVVTIRHRSNGHR